MIEREEHDDALDERLADWVDGRLDPAVHAEFERWLAADPERSAHADSYRRTVVSLRAALAQGPHVSRDFADRVLDAAVGRIPTRENIAEARRFARIGSAAAAAIFVLLFFVVQRLDRGSPAAEELASGRSQDGVSSRQEPLPLGFDGFVGTAAEPAPAGIEERVRWALADAEPDGVQIDVFLGGGARGEPPQAGGGGRRTRSVAGPSTPGPAVTSAAAPQPEADGPAAGASELFFRGRSEADAGPIGALVFVITWPNAKPEQPPLKKRGGDPDVPPGIRIDPANWLRSRLAASPQDNVIVLPEDLVPLDLGPARLALGESPEAVEARSPGEYWPAAGDAAFLVRGDAAQRERILRVVLRAAREQGADLGLARSRFRRLDLREEGEESRDPAGSDVALVLRGVIPAAPSASEERR